MSHWRQGEARALIELIILLLLANGAPVVAARLAGQRLAWPVDGGLVCRDGQPLLGPSKTWRGLAAGVLTATAAGWPLNLDPALGAAAGALSLLGDLLSSFVKRRMGVPPSGQATGLDQIPEALLPAAVLAPALGLGVAQVVAVVATFMALELLLSVAGYRVGLRRRPY